MYGFGYGFKRNDGHYRAKCFIAVDLEVFEVIRRATEAVGEFGPRVSLVLKADIRPGHSGELTGKLDRLERALDEL